MKLALIKLSGKTIDTFTTSDNGLNILNRLKTEYDGIVIVHGGGKLITEWSEKLGHVSTFHEGQRVTCANTIEVVSSVQGGLLNNKMTSYLFTHNIKTIGLNGIDGGLFKAEQLDEKLGYVGKPVQASQVDWILDLIDKGFVPVFSSICADETGQLMNVNADVFSSALAIALNAQTVLFFSDVDGVQLNNKYQNLLTTKEIKSGITSGEISGGMIPKMKSCMELIDKGISKLWIGNDFNDFNEVLKNKKRGTWIVGEKRIAV
ncbi:MAG: acetylglutamate kinase [Melioribacteraceae bacterium]|nr:acetylglutamate kinase [Melioribacteraceae bacterium]